MREWWRQLPQRDRQGWLRTGAVAVAVTALLGSARAGTPRSGVLVLLVGFVVVATVWVRGQYADSLDGDPWLLPPLWVATLVAAGVALLGLYAVAEWDGAALSGAILLYFATGAQVARWRNLPRRRLLWGLSGLGLGLLTAAVVAGGLGAALLGRVGAGFGLVPLLLLGAGLLALGPVAVALLSEDAITGLAGPGIGDARRRGLLGVVGLTAFAVLTMVAVAWSDSPLAWPAAVVLGLLVVALASSTQADIAVVLGVLALLGVTPLQAALPDALRPGGREHVLVALGDSYMSGDGADIYYRGTDDGGRDMCRRSPTAWAAMAGQQRPFDGALFLACSGASTYNVRADPSGRPRPSGQPGEDLPQLAQYRRLQEVDPFHPELVVLTVGGNDAGFATVGVMCLAPGNCNRRASLWLDGLGPVERALRRTYDEVRDTFPGTPVVVVPYPDPIAEGHADCTQVSLSLGERAFLRRFVAGLDRRAERAARAHGFYYLGRMRSALADSHLQLCDPLNAGRPGINFIGLRSVNGIAEQRFNPVNWVHNSLHPNERGHAAMLRVFQSWLAERGPLAPTAAAVDAGPPPAGGSAVQCDLSDDSALGCRTQGTTFIAQQLGLFVLQAGLVAGPLMAAAGTAAVAFFAWRRRLHAQAGQAQSLRAGRS